MRSWWSSMPRCSTHRRSWRRLAFRKGSGACKAWFSRKDALASASSRHRQAEIMEEAGLGQLRHAPAATPTPQKLEKLCALAAEGLAERRWQHAAQLAALETAHALADELS